MNTLESQGEIGKMKLLRRIKPEWTRGRTKWLLQVGSAAALNVALAACATPPEPKIEIRTVQVPVAIRCAAPLSSDPQYSDTPDAIRAAPDIFARTQLILAGRAQRNARIAELTAAISGCVG